MTQYVGWSYSGRLKAARGNRPRQEIADQLSKVIGRAVGATQIASWENGTRPRAAHLIESWIRKQEPVKVPPAPRPHVGLSFSLFLDTATDEEAENIVRLLEGLIVVIRARWPNSESPKESPRS